MAAFVPVIAIALSVAAVAIALFGDVDKPKGFWAMWACIFAAIVLSILSVGAP